MQEQDLPIPLSQLEMLVMRFQVKKQNMQLSYDAANALLGTFPRKIKTYFHTKSVHECLSSFVYNCQKLEITQLSFNEWMNKQTLLHLFHGILLSNKNKWVINTVNILHVIILSGKKPIPNAYSLHDFDLYSIVEMTKL